MAEKTDEQKPTRAECVAAAADEIIDILIELRKEGEQRDGQAIERERAIEQERAT